MAPGAASSTAGGAASLGDLSLLYNLASGGAGGSGKVGGDGGAGEGGGVFSDVNADLTVQNTRFVENAATGGLGGSGGDLRTSGRGGPGSGGGIFGAGGVSAFVTIQVDTPSRATRPPAAAPRSATAAPARAGRSPSTAPPARSLPSTS